MFSSNLVCMEPAMTNYDDLSEFEEIFDFDEETFDSDELDAIVDEEDPFYRPLSEY